MRIIISIFLLTYQLFSSIQSFGTPADSLLAVLETTLPDTQRVQVLDELAQLYWNNTPEEALRYSEQALALANRIDFPFGRSRALLTMGKTYWAQGNYPQALEVLSQALKIAQNISHSPTIAEAFNGLGLMQEKMGNVAQSLSYYQEALRYAEEMGSSMMIAKAHNNIGNIYFRQGNYSDALQQYLGALRIFEKQENPALIAAAYLNIGSVYSTQQDYKEALDYYNRALTLCQKVNNKPYLSAIYNGLGELNSELGNYQQAEEQYQAAFDIAQEMGGQSDAAVSLSNLGRIAYYQKNYALALTRYQRALSIQEEAQDQSSMITSLGRIGQAYQQQQRYDLATDYAQRGLAMAQKTGAKKEITEIARSLSEMYEQQRDYQPALTYHKLYNQYQDSLVNEEKAKTIEQVKFAHQLERKNLENNWLKVQNGWQTQQVTLQTRIKNFFIAGTILLLLLAFVLLRSQRKERSINRLLNQKNQEILAIHAQVDAQKQVLEASNRSKDKLFSLISHDMRSPLNSLQGLLSLFQDGNLSRREVNELLPEITHRLDHTNEMLDNLLLWARSQMQGLRPHPKPGDLAVAVQEAVQLSEQQAKNKGVRIQNEVASPFMIRADHTMVESVLRNLLTNAIKFTPHGGTVTIQSTTDHDYAWVYISDTGVGISPEDQEKLFSENHTTQGTVGERGTGLGLKLTKEFVESNGGELRVESILGEGSTFTFSLPLASE